MSKGDEGKLPEEQSRESSTEPSLSFRINEQSCNWTYQQAFAQAHLLIKEKNYETAEMILKTLIQVPDRGPRAHIMLALCKAGASDYKGSRAILDAAFQSDETTILAAVLHDVIVNARMGFRKDAMQELVQLVNEHKELPTLCLWLGDMLACREYRSCVYELVTRA